MTVTSKKKGCYCCVFQSGSAERQSKVSALLTGHKVSEVVNLVGVPHTTAYAIKKCMDDGEGVNGRAGRG